jgi:Flp pilus assembly protein TadB
VTLGAGLGFIVAVGCCALGFVMVARLVTHRTALPRVQFNAEWWRPLLRSYGVALAVGAGVLIVTRWPLAGLAAAVVTAMWPRLYGGGALGRRQLAKTEAIASWTESLRDTSSAASGLEQAIPATAGATPPLLRAPVRDLAARLDGRVPLPEALSRFADDVDDPAADMVVAALLLNARQRAGGLERILTALAESARAELEMRRKVEHERRALRRQSQRIALAVVGFAILQAVFAHGWVRPYSSSAGQLVLAILLTLFIGAFARMKSLSAAEAEPRFLSVPSQGFRHTAYAQQRIATIGGRS